MSIQNDTSDVAVYFIFLSTLWGEEEREETVLGDDNSVNSLSYLIDYENVNMPFSFQHV